MWSFYFAQKSALDGELLNFCLAMTAQVCYNTIADNIYFGDSKKDGAAGGQSDEAASFTPAPSGSVPVDVDAGELPF